MTAPKIIELRIVLVEVPLDPPVVVPFGRMDTRRSLLVIVETEAGISGTGEVWSNFPPWGPCDRIGILRNVVRPALVGQQLDDPHRLQKLLLSAVRLMVNQLGARGPFEQALAGVDIALWDAHARLMGVPLADAIRGGPGVASADVYATNLPITDPESVARMRERGHTRFKFRISADPELTVRGLAEARRIAGAEPLMADATQGLSLELATRLLPALRDLQLGWLEEPFPVDDLDCYRSWAQLRDRPPLAMGENSYGSTGFDELVRVISPEIVQPDITKTAGISQGAMICRGMKAAGAQVSLHMYGGPVGLYASAHLAAALPEIDLVEMDALPNPLFGIILMTAPKIVAGSLTLLPGAGHGVEIDGDLVERFEVPDA